MRKTISFLAILILFLSCKEEVVKKPERLIKKEKMVDIMYDLAVLEGVKYQNPTSLVTYDINPSQYIYKKYKIDSLQFAQSNVYYASNYEEYKDVFDEIIKRINDQKTVVDSLVKIENKKKAKLDSIKLKKAVPVAEDTLIPQKKKIENLKLARKNLKNNDSLIK
ncbi:DUF4296 domain-containing protein [Flavobacterium frigoris]|uniref:DUF4296 domain-containing protein n=1 Tax=Flavobacterium frigoris (strain PS1) TaxID=1086011 RepID=H7FPS9_FLAFP|nr:DUF4296 domain-containing protein [Flavobacterium frigoris]EIA09283.1 hypothetical protein HJ01_01189 [Flavobacterium frigoris PS1]